MASPRTSCLLVFLLLFGAISLNASDKPPRPKHPLPPKPAAWKPVQHESYVAYWTLEAGWNTRLEIRNNVPWHDLSVTPVLRTAAGTESLFPSVTISPNEIKELNLRVLAVAAAPNLLDKPTSFGSVALRFNSNDEENVFSSTIIERTGSPIAFHFDGEHGTDAGNLDSNSHVVDSIGLTSNAPLPPNLSIIQSQTIAVGGFYVRTNTITFSASGVSVANGGPYN